MGSFNGFFSSFVCPFFVPFFSFVCFLCRMVSFFNGIYPGAFSSIVLTVHGKCDILLYFMGLILGTLCFTCVFLSGNVSVEIF